MNSGRSNHRFYYAGDYKRSRVKWVGTKCVLDSAHPVHATMKIIIQGGGGGYMPGEAFDLHWALSQGNAYAFV